MGMTTLQKIGWRAGRSVGPLSPACLTLYEDIDPHWILRKPFLCHRIMSSVGELVGEWIEGSTAPSSQQLY